MTENETNSDTNDYFKQLKEDIIKDTNNNKRRKHGKRKKG